MKAFITKWALTQGIIEAEVEPQQSFPGWVRFWHRGVLNGAFRSQSHAVRQEAVAKAIQMRDARIRLLQKQIDKLEKMEFK